MSAPTPFYTDCFILHQIINHQVTREKLVQGRYHMLLQRVEGESELGIRIGCTPGPVAADFIEEGGKDNGFSSRERVVVSKCYSKIETSSSQHQIKQLVYTVGASSLIT